MRLVECVPNFSEGRDTRIIEAMTRAAADVDGVRVLDVDPGADTHRTVLTFVGSPQAVSEAAFQVIAKGAELIDMRKHTGAHARHGAVDVCPFVPVTGVSMEDCADLARRLGARVGAELGIPVYLYEHAASRPERRNLAAVRKGEYEALPEKLSDPVWAPDFGPAEWSEPIARTGVTTIGAREFLIAYNVNLNTRDKRYAIDVAFDIRERGRSKRRGNTDPHYFRGELVRYRPDEGVMPCGLCDAVEPTAEDLSAHYRQAHDFDWEAFLDEWNQPRGAALRGRPVKKPGRFPHCKATGWVIEDYGCAQITMNLTNHRVTPPHVVLETCRRLARRMGVEVTGSEIVGVIPFDALLDAGRFYQARYGGTTALPARDLLELAVRSMGLDDVAPFDIDQKVLGLPERPDRCLMALPARDLVDEISRESPAPGGGSVAALAGAIGAALASMVANLTIGKEGFEAVSPELDALALRAQDIKDRLTRSVDTDTEAFNVVLDAMRLPKGTPAERAARKTAISEAYKTASEIPLETARLCLEALRLCEPIARKGNPPSLTDAGVGALMTCAGVEGAIYNVRVNLPNIDDPAFCARMSAQLDAMVEQARALRDTLDAYVRSSLT